MKSVVVVLFYGVIHPDDGVVNRVSPVRAIPGSIHWAGELSARHRLMIYSRDVHRPGGVRDMRDWLVENGMDRQTAGEISFPTLFPKADLYVGSRFLRFEGCFPGLDQIQGLICPP